MTPNLSACRISYTDGTGRRGRSWCGSGGIVGFDDDGAALILTNAHVSGSPNTTSAKRIARFLLNNRTVEFDATEIVAYGFSDRFAVDWAILRCPGIQEGGDFEAFPMLKEKPAGTRFNFSGSPNCIWPQSHIDIALVAGSPAAGVRFWQPRAIGGQSGSNVGDKIGDDWVCQLLLTWLWNGNGAGQETSQIYNNVVNANNVGAERPEGLVEMAELINDRNLSVEYFECDKWKTLCVRGLPKELVLENVNSLPIWYNPTTTEPDEPTDPIECDNEASAKLRRLKELRELHAELEKQQGDIRTETEKILEDI